MNFAYIMTPFENADVNNKFSPGYFICKSLEKLDMSYIPVGPFKEDYWFFRRGLNKIRNKISSKIYLNSRNQCVIKSIARKSSNYISNIIKNKNIDFCLSFGTLPMAYLNINIPKFIWTDATFKGLLNYYPDYMNLSDRTIKDAEELEYKAFNDSEIIFFTSKWAADSALNDYKLNPEKVRVVPFGANIEKTFSEIEIQEIINNRVREKIKLLFIGASWHRKGADIAIEATKILNNKNYKVELNIIGCLPDKTSHNQLPEYIKLHGYLKKSNLEEADLINKLFTESHFFILPTHADCSPHVINEASSMGLPCIAPNTGGISDLIKTGTNGILLDSNSKPEIYAESISSCIKDFDEYKKLCYNSYLEYNNKLNWDVSASQVSSIIKNKLKF